MCDELQVFALDSRLMFVVALRCLSFITLSSLLFSVEFKIAKSKEF